jgi:hypothetical protein
MQRSKISRELESKAFRIHLKYRARKRDNELSQRCVRCPKTVEDGYACCQACRTAMAQGKRQAREQGLCRDCWTEPALPGKSLCATHNSIQRQAWTTRYMQRLVSRQCVRCGKSRAERGTTMCQKCAAKQQEYAQKKRLRCLGIRPRGNLGALPRD